MTRVGAVARRAWPFIGFGGLVVTPLALLALIGWAGLGLPLPGIPGAASGPAPGGEAQTVQILSPREGATIKGPDVRVRFKLNGTLVKAEQILTDTREGLVHLHVQFDDGKYDDPAHSSSKLFDIERSSASFSGSVTRRLNYRDIPPGAHMLRVELVHNDHVPGSGIAESRVSFTTVAP